MNSFESILSHILKVGSDNLEMFGGEFEGGYYLQQNPYELAKLVYFLKNNCVGVKNYLEIGAAACGLTRIMHDFFKIPFTTIIDDGKHPRSKFATDNLTHVKGFLRFHVGNSHNWRAEEFLFSQKKKYDFVVIDGDHSEVGVELDIKLVRRFVAEDNLVMFHDHVECPGVRKAIENARDAGILDEIQTFESKEKPLGIWVGALR